MSSGSWFWVELCAWLAPCVAWRAVVAAAEPPLRALIPKKRAAMRMAIPTTPPTAMPAMMGVESEVRSSEEEEGTVAELMVGTTSCTTGSVQAEEEQEALWEC